MPSTIDAKMASRCHWNVALIGACQLVIMEQRKHDFCVQINGAVTLGNTMLRLKKTIKMQANNGAGQQESSAHALGLMPGAKDLLKVAFIANGKCWCELQDDRIVLATAIKTSDPIFRLASALPSHVDGIRTQPCQHCCVELRTILLSAWHTPKGNEPLEPGFMLKLHHDILTACQEIRQHCKVGSKKNGT